MPIHPKASRTDREWGVLLTSAFAGALLTTGDAFLNDETGQMEVYSFAEDVWNHISDRSDIDDAKDIPGMVATLREVIASLETNSEFARHTQAMPRRSAMALEPTQADELESTESQKGCSK